jgi:hypothetical protein
VGASLQVTDRSNPTDSTIHFPKHTAEHRLRFPTTLNILFQSRFQQSVKEYKLNYNRTCKTGDHEKDFVLPWIFLLWADFALRHH